MAGNLKLLGGLAAGYVLGARAVVSATSGSPRPPAGWPSDPGSAGSPPRSAPASAPAWRRPPAPPATGSSRPGARTAAPQASPGPRPTTPRGAGGTPAGPRQRPAPPAAAVASGAAGDASADVRTPVAQESFLGRPQGRPSTTTWATSATGRRDDLAADRMRR